MTSFRVCTDDSVDGEYSQDHKYVDSDPILDHHDGF